jgi:hypothetical protein
MLKNVVVARSCTVQAVLSLFTTRKRDVLACFQQLREFPDHQLTSEELKTDLPGYYSSLGKTLIRWNVKPFNVVIFFEDGSASVEIQILQHLNDWRVDDPRYNSQLKKMRQLLDDIAERVGFKQCDLSSADKTVQKRMKALQRAYGLFGWYQSDETAFLVTVALQGMGCDPFVREVKQIPAPKRRTQKRRRDKSYDDFFGGLHDDPTGSGM